VLDQNCPDFVKLADAYGWLGLRVSDSSQLDKTLMEAFEHDGPAIVDVRVARLECVFPMVAPGGSIDEMLGGVPGGPVSDMIDDAILEEVWE
jgi:acetolactate synthase-1/2/3 large subunit